MSIRFNSLSQFTGNLMAIAALLLIPFTALADNHGETERARGMVMTMEAEVVDIDLETREVSLQSPTGEIVTVKASEQIVKLEDVAVGDVLVATYIAALEGELREPTEEELAEPWVAMDKAAVSDDIDHPGVGEARVIRAVTTVEGMNRALGTVTLKDSRGKLHLIGDVEPEKMEGVSLGDTIVVIYKEAVALTLEKKGSTEEAAAE